MFRFSPHSDFVQGSKLKLERRVAEFLNQANPKERMDLEISHAKLLHTLTTAEKEYEQRHIKISPESMQKKSQEVRSKIKAGCKAFSATVYEYSQIMDMLATQAPEYVALAWGAVKIVLIVQINHEELKQKVREHMELIKSRFEIIEHLTAYNP